MKIRRFTLEARVRVSRNYQSAEAGATIEIELDESEASMTITQAIAKSKPKREELLEAVRQEAEAILQSL